MRSVALKRRDSRCFHNAGKSYPSEMGEALSAERRYQVFVSSTFADLVEERRAIVQALLSLDLFPAGMELFPATNDDQWALIKSVIQDSDYYLIIVGGRYGSTTPEGVSYTEKEFDYALEQKKPILAFVHGKPEKIPVGKTDQNDAARVKLESFKGKVLTGRHAKFWETPSDLQAAVIQGIAAETKRNPQEGWVRASLASDPMTVAKLREELAQLRADGPPSNVDDFMGGRDRYEFQINYKTAYGGPWLAHKISLRWDTIFREVGPLLMHEASESMMRDRLEKECIQYRGVQGARGPTAVNTSLANEEFDTIKIQLFALGLIQRGKLKRAVSDHNVYWTLTPYGQDYLMKLRALLRRDTSPEDDEE